MATLAIMPDETIMYMKSCEIDNTAEILNNNNQLDLYLRILTILYTINAIITLSTFVIFQSFIFIIFISASIIGLYGACFKKQTSLALCVCGTIIDIIAKFIFIEKEMNSHSHIHNNQIWLDMLLPFIFMIIQFFICMYTIFCVSNFD